MAVAGLGVPPEQLKGLAVATPREKVFQLPKAGRMLDYVTARFVMDRLDAVVGPENWQSKFWMEGEKVACSIGVKVNGEWVWKSDGSGETDVEPEKGSFSGALKRAAISWGIARDLYPDAETHQGGQTRRPAQADAGRDAPPSRPAAAPSGDGSIPKCSLHGYPMKPSRNGSGYYCSSKAREGEPNRNGWCVERAG